MPESVASPLYIVYCVMYIINAVMFCCPGRKTRGQNEKKLHLQDVRAVLRAVRALRRHACPRRRIPHLMSLQCEAPAVDDSCRDKPLCSVEAPPDPKGSHPAAVAPTPDTFQGSSVADPPSTTPAATPTANRCPTPILPWTPDQATPTTPPALFRDQVSQGSPYQPLSPTEYYALPV